MAREVEMEAVLRERAAGAADAVGAVIGVGSTVLWTWQVALVAVGSLAVAMLVLLGWLARIPMEPR